MRLAAAPRQHLCNIGLAIGGFFTAGALAAAPLPGGFAHSGWYQFEVIVLADTQSETLESETWPLSPSVGYPTRWRWLRDHAIRAKLTEAYPDATVIASPSGHLSVRRPGRPAPVWTAPEGLLTEGDLAPIDELTELGKRTETSGHHLILETPALAKTGPDSEATAAPLLPFEEIAPAAPTPLTALESLGVMGSTSEPAPPSVAIPFAAPSVLPELRPVTVVARSIPMPKSFIRLPLQQLAPGLSRYRRISDDELIASASWLQGPQDDRLALLLEPNTGLDYPLVQGFIQLLPRGDSWRLGINFWANTQGHYLPDFFETPPPPPSPQRVAVIEAAAESPLLLTTGAPPQKISEESLETVGRNNSFKSAMPVTWLQHNEPIAAEINGDASEHASIPYLARRAPAPEMPQWPWRHMIHLADTVPLTQNRLRYYDHPVIKVIAFYRELSWYEVFARGRSELSESEIEAIAE